MEEEIARKCLSSGQEAELYDDGYDNYSGRGMYGERTTAIVVPDVDTARTIDDIISIEEYEEKGYFDEDQSHEEKLEYLIDQGLVEDNYRYLNNFRMDNLGLSMIIY